MLEFKLNLTRSEFKSLLYCAANIFDVYNMNWVHRPERCDTSFGSKGILVIWKGGTDIDLTIRGREPGEGVHWEITLTDGSIKV